MQSEAIQRNTVQTETMQIGGMLGPACATKVDAALAAIPGVSAVQTAFDTRKATVSFNPAKVSRQLLAVAITDAGYEYFKPVHGEDGNCCGGCGG